MSQTQTILQPATILETLRVYDVHETGHEDTPETHSSPTQNNGVEEPQSAARSDPNWPSNWRRIPAYRASSRTHRVADRVAGRDAAEGVMVLTMFHGVWLMGVRIHLCWLET